MPGYPPAPLSETPPKSLPTAAAAVWVRRVAAIVNQVLQGRLNVTVVVTLAAGAPSTAVADARIGAFCGLLFTPLTAHAAAEVPTLWVSSQISGEAVLMHSNNAETDRTFTMTIIG